MSIVYDISDINTILNNGFTYKLDKKVIDIIQQISDQVGSPEYIKTPQFSKSKCDKKMYRDMSWGKIKDFKKTEFAKKSNEDIQIDNIRKYLNKITDKTYDNLIIKIINDLEAVENIENSDKIYNNIGESIFNIASTNIFFSELYAKLYKDLMNKFIFMKEIFKHNYDKFSDIYKNIEYCDAQIDYDKYCENNKTNDKRKALSMFYINLMKLGVITKNSIIELILEIQEYLFDKIDIEANIPVVHELSEVLFIFITNSVENLKDETKWSKIYNNVEQVSHMKAREKVGLTNKSIFKHMDIIDNIKTKLN